MMCPTCKREFEVVKSIWQRGRPSSYCSVVCRRASYRGGLAQRCKDRYRELRALGATSYQAVEARGTERKYRALKAALTEQKQ